MNESTLEYIESLASTDLQKKLIQLISTEKDDEVVLKELIKILRGGGE
jgi:hypothetical protein